MTNPGEYKRYQQIGLYKKNASKLGNTTPRTGSPPSERSDGVLKYNLRIGKPKGHSLPGTKKLQTKKEHYKYDNEPNNPYTYFLARQKAKA